MSTFGNVVQAKVVMDKATGRSKGYGFATFSTPQEAQAAVKEGFLIIDGNKCNCNLASLGVKEDKKRAAFTNPAAVHPVYGLPLDMGYSMPPSGDYYSQEFQMNMQSMQSMYQEICNIKYDISALNQTIANLKNTTMLIKAGIDHLVALPANGGGSSAGGNGAAGYGSYPGLN
uniref:RRM domain-containing protein n=1 Tax=Arcella intermedia TaxID=1963864 RepID=A0A6B2LKE6_9EUKA